MKTELIMRRGDGDINTNGGGAHGEQAAARASLTRELTLHNTRSGERSAGSKCTFHQNLTPKIKIEEPD